MKTFFFTFRNNEEKISTCKAKGYEEAVEFFATLKKLNVDIFLKLYDVSELEEALI